MDLIINFYNKKFSNDKMNVCQPQCQQHCTAGSVQLRPVRVTPCFSSALTVQM